VEFKLGVKSLPWPGWSRARNVSRDARSTYGVEDASRAVPTPSLDRRHCACFEIWARPSQAIRDNIRPRPPNDHLILGGRGRVWIHDHQSGSMDRTKRQPLFEPQTCESMRQSEDGVAHVSLPSKALNLWMKSTVTDRSSALRRGKLTTQFLSHATHCFDTLIEAMSIL